MGVTAVAVAVSQDDINSFQVDEEGKAEDVEEKEEVENIDINADGETLNSEDIVMENGSEDPEADNTEEDFNQTVQMSDEKEEDAVSDDKETVQNQQQIVVRLTNGSTNGYKKEGMEEDEEDDSSDESVEDSTIGTTLLDDENLSALRPVSVTRHSSTISNELGILAEEEEEEEGEGQISFQTQTSNPFDGLEDGKMVEKEEGGSLSKASSKRSVHFDHGEFIFTNGKANGILESHFGYDDKKNPFMDTFDDS